MSRVGGTGRSKTVSMQIHSVPMRSLGIGILHALSDLMYEYESPFRHRESVVKVWLFHVKRMHRVPQSFQGSSINAYGPPRTSATHQRTNHAVA